MGRPPRYDPYEHELLTSSAAIGDGEIMPTKRVANSVEFLGQMVSYPQYIRLRRIQAEVIKMDKANL